MVKRSYDWMLIDTDGKILVGRGYYSTIEQIEYICNYKAKGYKVVKEINVSHSPSITVVKRIK